MAWFYVIAAFAFLYVFLDVNYYFRLVLTVVLTKLKRKVHVLDETTIYGK